MKFQFPQSSFIFSGLQFQFEQLKMNNQNIQTVFAYNGRDFSLVEDQTAVQIAGNAIVLWNTQSGKKDYIWSKRNGYCMVTSNYNTGLLAAAEYGLKPECHIYKYSNRQLVHTFPMDTTVKCIGMAFSRCGKYLIMIGGVPDFRVSVYDVENKKKLVFPETKLPCKPEEFLSVKFNPANSNQFCILSQTVLYSFTINQAYDVTERGEQKILGESYRMQVDEFRDENPDLTFHKFCWDQFSRVHIVTDSPVILMVDPKHSKLENTLNLSTAANCCLFTQKHLVVSLADGLINWFKLDVPHMMANEKDDGSKKMTVLEEVEMEWNLGYTIGETGEQEQIAHMHYSRSFRQLIMGTSTGLFGKLEVEAEANQEDEEEDEAQKQREKRVLDHPFNELGRFHTSPLTGIKELGETTQVMTIGTDHYMTLWETTSAQPLSSVYQPSHPTACEANLEGTAAFIGTSKGAFRIYDVVNRSEPRLIQQIRFFDVGTPVDLLRASKDGKFLLIGSSKVDFVYIMSQESTKGFAVYGFIKFPGNVMSTCFTTHKDMPHILAVLSNNVLAGCAVPLKQAANRRENFTEAECKMFFRKIDRGSNMVSSSIITGDIYVHGQDKLMKKYDFPEEKWENIEYRKAPPAPVMELSSHSIGTACWDFSKEYKQFATGGKDGCIILRNMNNIGNGNEIKAHTLFTGGVAAIAFSNTRTTLYTAGGDGSFMAWVIGGKPNPSQPVPLNNSHGKDISEMPEIERCAPEQIKNYQSILEEEFALEQTKAKEAFRQQLLVELGQIKDKLMDLLAENEQATDIEQLERDEFVIDTMRSEKIKDEGSNECEEIRKEAEKTVLRLELLRERVKESTWDKMETHQKAIKSIQSDTLIFNYPVRKRTSLEVKHLNMVLNTRKMELKEKLARIELSLKEALDEEEFSQFLEGYLMNRVKGMPEYIEDESIAEAAQEFADKEIEKKLRKEKAEQNQANLNNPNQVGKKQPILKITKGKLGNKTKKRDDGDDDANKKSKQTVREIRGMEEMYWKVVFQIKTIDDIKKCLEMPNALDVIYEPYELYPDVRKRNQIELLKAAVFELKKDFNDEFTSLEKFKEDQIYMIKEKNTLIEELLQNLQQSEELFEPVGHPLEDPENIFKISDDEIKVEKYLTREERAALEEAERIRLEREALLKGDNVGQRGLKTMMGSTELNLKKDKNLMDENLVKEDWMEKDEKDMSEEEKQKLKEFKQKEKEFKDKQKKAWEQDLKKIKGEIIEIQLRFEEKLLMLFKKKLFIDVRILEQELYVIRLVIMQHDGKETRTDEKKYRQEAERLFKEKALKEELIQTFKGFAQDLEARYADDSSIREQEKELRRMFPEANRQIQAFVKNGKGKRQAMPGEVNQREQELSRGIVELDPFTGVDRNRVKQILKDDDEREQFDFEKDNVTGLSEEDFERLVQERYSRVEMNKDKEKLENQIKQLNDHITHLEDLFHDLDEQHEGQTVAQQKALDRINKIRFNFEVIVYLKQGQIEVPQLPVATDYKDGILIAKDLVDYENKEIVRKGELKIKLMEDISNFKVNLKKVKYQKQRLDLEIKDFEERAKDVQLYRVTKQTQEIIQGKHMKKDEEDKKRLENQIKQLEENAQKRIRTINETKSKLKREIREKRMESEQLETKARQLQNNVDQRKQIMSLKSNTMTDGDADPSKKIKEVAHKRKLLDIAKQQTEEIEVLRDELDRLRARTFPSFAHLHNKPGYPDEN